ncbi:MAG: S8 family serine peptidase [bacterium]|nr:S8 family serine peptidase [bacterium]
MSSHALASRCAALLLLLLCTPLLVQGADPDRAWHFLPADDIGAPAFHAAHPGWDGRGVVIAILDTGVDAFAPGLLQTSTGQTKLIDVRDFGTEGDWDTAEAVLDDSGTDAAPVYADVDGVLLRGAADLPVPPATGEGALPVYMGVVTEPDFVDSHDVHDLNDDGDTTDSFGFIVYQAARADVEAALGVGAGYDFLADLNETAAATVAKERASQRVWVVVMDTDGNGDLADEAILRDYRVNHDSFALGADNDPESRSLMAWNLNVRTNEDHLGAMTAPTVEFHFDDGAHGSHCAGIAAGYQVSGQEGLNGVAPGAWVMSLKIGDNRLSGGATRTSSMKKAYEYAAAFEEKWGIPVVVNMSFGINSVEEGDDAMGRWLDDLLADHPTLYVCTSAGNEGPGLSTVGLPATSPSVIASGAYLSVGAGADLYNAGMDRASLFNFSSRGGETAKPDVVAPGTALSTVPGFIDGMARFNGTSMASPQTAGAIACLAGAAVREELDIHWGMVKRALIAGGVRVEGKGLLDQGGGLVHLENSWKILRDLARSGSAGRVLRWDISTPCAFQADGLSDASYWRTPGGAPVAPERVTFTVRPVFHPDLDPDARDAFFRSFSFRSEADWLKVISGDRYVRGDMGMTVRVEYDGDKIEAPGVHAARVVASLDGGDLSGLAAREFYLWNTVVVGEPSGPVAGWVRVFEGEDLAQSDVSRHYVDAPAGASAMRVRLEVSPDVGSSRGAAAFIEICDPEGVVRGGWSGYAEVDGRQIRDLTILPPELRPGTWELNVGTGITNRDLTDYRLTVSFDGYAAEPARLCPAGGDLTVTRVFEGTFRGQVEAALEGFRATETIEIEKADVWTRSFTLDETTPSAEFHLVMSEKVANLFTDCAVNILDASGKSVRGTSFDGREARVRANFAAGSYKLQVVGAFAIAADMAAWGFDLEEKFFFGSPRTGAVARAGGGRLTLPCGVPVKLDVTFPEGGPAVPEGKSLFGAIRFRDTRTDDRRPGDSGGRLVCEVPVGREPDQE